MSSKSRDLTIHEYWEQLQLEYIVAELRRKIYPIVKDKKYYERVMEQKRQKIDDISTRNHLAPIFEDSEYKQEMYEKIYNEQGIPNFIYRDEKMRALFEENDVVNYYYEGSEVRVKVDNKTSIGKIESVNLMAELVEVKIKEEIKNFPMKDVTRIL